MAVPLGKVEIILEPGALEGELAGTIAELLHRNVDGRYERERLVAALSFDAAFVVPDGPGKGQTCTVSFQGSSVRVYPWLKERPALTIRGSLQAILRLTRIPLFQGMPLLWSVGAARLWRAVVGRELSVDGLADRLPEAVGLVQALSVEERSCPFGWI